jgi:hypothetical protein
VSIWNGTLGGAILADLGVVLNFSYASTSGGNAERSYSRPIKYAYNACRDGVAGRGCTIFTMSPSDGSLPMEPANSCSSLRASSHCKISRLGSEPRLLRPTTPDRMTCTKLRSIFGESITRSKISAIKPGPFTDSTAHSNAGMSFM